MLHVTGMFEDIRFIATRRTFQWTVEIEDFAPANAPGYTVELNDTQFGCMMLLTAGAGEDHIISDAMVKEAYAILEPVFKGKPFTPFP